MALAVERTRIGQAVFVETSIPYRLPLFGQRDVCFQNTVGCRHVDGFAVDLGGLHPDGLGPVAQSGFGVDGEGVGCVVVIEIRLDGFGVQFAEVQDVSGLDRCRVRAGHRILRPVLVEECDVEPFGQHHRPYDEIVVRTGRDLSLEHDFVFVIFSIINERLAGKLDA